MFSLPLFVVSFSLVAQASANDAPRYLKNEIRVTVVDEKKRPVSGASLEWLDLAKGTVEQIITRTQADGSATIALPAGPRFMLRATSPSGQLSAPQFVPAHAVELRLGQSPPDLGLKAMILDILPAIRESDLSAEDIEKLLERLERIRAVKESSSALQLPVQTLPREGLTVCQSDCRVFICSDMCCGKCSVTPCRAASDPCDSCSGNVHACGTCSRDSDASPIWSTGRLNVSVPSDATVFINGRRTISTGSSRTYISSGLREGKIYTYVISVQFVRNQRLIESTKNVVLHANEEKNVVFSLSRISEQTLASNEDR